MATNVRREVAGWVGWSYFAGLLMVLAGIFQSVIGLTALLNEGYFEAANRLVVFDMATWGWLHLLLGALVIVAGTAVVSAQRWGWVAGVLLAMLGIVANFLFVAVSPTWAVIMLLAFVLILYSLVVQGE